LYHNTQDDKAFYTYNDLMKELNWFKNIETQ
jgi:hypothetical protein